MHNELHKTKHEDGKKLFNPQKISRIKIGSPHQDGFFVYNLKVEDDESYIAGGMIVHNCGEAACIAYKREYGIDVRLCRIFNSYGEKMARDGRAIPHFVERALKDKYLPVFGDGTQTRAFLYAEDLVEGILLQTLADNISGLPINIGADKETTVLNLAEKIIDISDSKSDIKFFPAPEDDPQRRLPDITRARELLGWEPVISLDEGLRRTINDLKIE